ncbi:MAG: paraquat-inducible protein A [Planctomycetota bacterium]|nr:paraquat-inducible protein A [Planctomycetota bacterium]
MTDGMETNHHATTFRACPCCGLAQRLPKVPPRMRACCVRCNTGLHKRSTIIRGNSRAAAIALAALILYPVAVTQPMLQVERFGHRHESSIIEGTITLLSGGQHFVGLVVLLCSVILPLGKLVSLLVLSAGGFMMRPRHRALTYHIVEFSGRWGMLDVLLVAVLVAALKIGDLVDVTAGPAAYAFTTVVLLSLLATAAFDPHSLWKGQPVHTRPTPSVSTTERIK